MKPLYFAAAALLTLSALSLAACRKTEDKRMDGTSSPALTNEATGAGESIVEKASEKLSEAGETISEKLSEAGETIRDGLTDASERISEMGTTDNKPGN
ncbi:MAG: hypothetical protein IJT27_01115 [Clostridia bacterium]|nr:hypothetical protein [Clostridia bacterium]